MRDEMKQEDGRERQLFLKNAPRIPNFLFFLPLKPVVSLSLSLCLSPFKFNSNQKSFLRHSIRKIDNFIFCFLHCCQRKVAKEMM